jgi:hypothetical protein
VDNAIGPKAVHMEVFLDGRLCRSLPICGLVQNHGPAASMMQETNYAKEIVTALCKSMPQGSTEGRDLPLEAADLIEQHEALSEAVETIKFFREVTHD